MSAIDVAVLGAGPAGLACAWELAIHGARVVVLEAEQQVGGLAATVERDGFRFDHGGHRFLTRWPELLERVQKLLGEELLLVDRHSVVVSEGILNRVEMAFRPYDPCLGCATHALPGQMPLQITIRNPQGDVVDVLKQHC